MVGVKFSRGCGGCRVRRRKCDEQRPSCGLCEQRNIECIYRDGMRFVAFDPSRREQSSSSETTGSTVLTPNSTPGFTSPSWHSGSEIDAVPQSCLASSYHVQAHGALLELYGPSVLVHSSGVSMNPRNAIGSSWLYSVYEQAHTNSLMSDSLAALSLAYHERQNALGKNALGSRVLYGRAMKTLMRRLGTGGCALDDSTLAAAMLLTQSSDPGLEDWYRHANGVSTILRIRGKVNVKTDLGRRLYLGARVLDLLSTIGKRKSLSVAEPNLRGSFEGSWSSYAHIFDILQTLPALIELGDKVEHAIVKGTEPELQASVSAYKFASAEMRMRLGLWRTQLGREENETEENPLVWNERSLLYQSLPADSPGRVFEDCLCFRNPDVAQSLAISWTCLLLVDGWLPIMQQKIEQYGRSTTRLFLTDFDQEHVHTRCNVWATDITKSLEYFLHPGMGLASTEFLGMPMTVAMGWFGKNRINAREVMWFPVILARMRQINAAFSDLMQLMVVEGGGGLAFRKMIKQSHSPSTW